MRENAGCDYDHFVLDQGSTDGTQEWLMSEYEDAHVIFRPDNIGIARGMNRLLDEVDSAYDVIVKADNDLELTQPNTLRVLCETALDTDWLLSPRINGLLQPPHPTREVEMAGETLLDVPQIGGICLAAPAWIYHSYRYLDDLPKWGLDDVHICAWHRARGGSCGYVKRLEANHYEGTEAQRVTYPEYWERKQVEMGIT